jgi:Carboxypeptidase regulatory-like domain
VLAVSRFCVSIAITLAVAQASATTCVADREFTVRQVCGVVSDKAGVRIPDVPVEVLNARSSVIQSVHTDANGGFRFESIPDGKYILRVNLNGFATAWQPFVVHGSKRSSSCRKPLRVRLELAGYCSGIQHGK